MAIDRERLARRLMETFLVELDEHARSLSAQLPGLAGPGREGLVDDLFRAAHSLKGAARSVGVKPVEEACHHLEDTLGAIREGGGPPDPDRLGLMCAAADALEEAGQRLREQRDLSDSPLAALLPRLAEGRRAGAEPEAAAIPPPAPRAEPPAAPRPLRAAGTLLRVGTDRIDAMIAHGGELVVARGRLEPRVAELRAVQARLGRLRAECRGLDRDLRRDRVEAPSTRGAAAAARRLGAQVDQVESTLGRLADGLANDARLVDLAAERLDEEIRHARVLPFADACLGLDAVAQDAAAEGGKRVELVVEGGQVRLDRSIMEGIRDSLAHLVRNAVDHGLEGPEERVAAGKPAAGRVVVSIRQRGDGVECHVADDGRGLDLPRLREAVARRGLAVPADTSSLAMLAFLPGLSTAGAVTRISGRGVGLDVVKARVDSLRGSIEVRTEPGRGTTFLMRWRLRLTMARVALMELGAEVYAIPSASIRRLRRVGPDRLPSLGGRPSLPDPGGPPIPVISLAEALGRPAPAARGTTALVLADAGRSAALLLDATPTERELLVRGLGPRLPRLRSVTGMTILASGVVAPILSASYLIDRAYEGSTVAASPPPAAPRRRRVLVVDDSITARMLQQTILETAGHEVLLAADGLRALDMLQAHEVDALVSDVEMPRMGGIALTRAVRADPRWARLPIVLFTSLAGEADVARGAEAGADAYLVKGHAEQRGLIETLEQLL